MQESELNLTPKQLILTIEPIYSIFNSQSLYSMILKIELFCNIYVTFFLLNALIIAEDYKFLKLDV